MSRWPSGPFQSFAGEDASPLLLDSPLLQGRSPAFSDPEHVAACRPVGPAWFRKPAACPPGSLILPRHRVRHW